MVGVERWLLEIDRTLFRVLRGYNLLERGPRIVLEYFELTYLLVYAFVPGCFGLLCWLGFRGAADNYWTTILIAGFGALRRTAVDPDAATQESRARESP